MTDTITQTDTALGIDLPSLWAVKFYNDDFTPMDFVTAVLMHFFRKTAEEASTIMLMIHEKGSAVVGEYTKDIAQTKAAHIVANARAQNHPLFVEAISV